MPSIPSRAEILCRLQQIATDKVPIDPSAMRPEAQLAEIGLDSFSLIELVFLVEEEFNIRIPMDAVRVKTVGDVLELIEKGVELSTAGS